MKLLHPLIAQLLNVFAQKVFQPNATHFRGATAERVAKKRKAGAYGRGLANHFAAENRKRLSMKGGRPLEDDNGAYTLVGDAFGGIRRQWRGGISAQRGY